MDIYLNSLLNLHNTQIQQCSEQEGGIELKLKMVGETTECPHCHQESEELHQTRYVSIRDLSVFGKQVYLQVPRRQFYCKACQKYFNERLEFVDLGRRYTQRYEKYVYERVRVSTVEQVSREEGLSWDQVQGIFRYRFSQEKKTEWGQVKRVSIDEISKRKGHKDFVTVVSDIDAGCLLEVIDSHEQDEIIKALKQQPLEAREKVEEVSVDMWGGFPKVVAEVFPNATLVIDLFHVVKPINKELNTIRKQVGIKSKGNRFLLLKNNEDLNKEEQFNLDAILKQSKRLRKAYELKESFREIFKAKISVEEGKAKLLAWLEKADSIYSEVLKTIRNHLDGICNYFKNRTTSGVMEGINNRLKVIKRQAYGFVNFENFRSRLLACFLD